MNDQQEFDSVDDIMKTDILTTTEYTPVLEAKETMEKNNIGSLPVINQNKLIGLITLNDFI